MALDMYACLPDASPKDQPRASRTVPSASRWWRAREARALLRAHRHRLRVQDLEDCLSQATLELVAQARAGARWAEHGPRGACARAALRLARARSPPRGVGPQPDAGRAGEALALGAGEGLGARCPTSAPGPRSSCCCGMELRRLPRLARGLSPDQQLVLASQVSLQMECAEFCALTGGRRRSTARWLSAPARACAGSANPSRVSRWGWGSEEESRDPPMTNSPPHRRVPWAAGGRLQARPHGAAHPRASGREPNPLLPRLPAARVPVRAGGAAVMLRAEALREVYRVYREDEMPARTSGRSAEQPTRELSESESKPGEERQCVPSGRRASRCSPGSVMALLGAGVGVVAALALHSLSASMAGKEGRGGVAAGGSPRCRPARRSRRWPRPRTATVASVPASQAPAQRRSPRPRALAGSEA